MGHQVMHPTQDFQAVLVVLTPSPVADDRFDWHPVVDINRDIPIESTALRTRILRPSERDDASLRPHMLLRPRPRARRTATPTTPKRRVTAMSTPPRLHPSSTRPRPHTRIITKTQ